MDRAKPLPSYLIQRYHGGGESFSSFFLGGGWRLPLPGPMVWHLHLWFLGRPARVGQFRGSPLIDWEENLPRVPQDVADANAYAVAARVTAAYGGTAHIPAWEPDADR